MEHVESALVLRELHIPAANYKPTGTGVPQYIFATSCNTVAVMQGSCMLNVNLEDLTSDALYNSVPKAAILGVAVSACSNFVAAYSADALYVAGLNGDRQLKMVCHLAGAKAVHWCPGRAVLAVLCQQVDPFVVIMQEQQQSTAAVMPTLKRLPGPHSATFGARCATWLPGNSSPNCAALLTAWPSDVLLYCWRQLTPRGAPDWQQFQVQRLVLGWPGPVRALAIVPCGVGSNTSSSGGGSCLVLGTVDSHLLPDAPAEIPMLQPGLQQQQEQQAGLVRTVSAGSGGPVEALTTHQQQAYSGSLLGSLMNIHAGPAAGTAIPVHPSPALAAADSGDVNLSSACLCLSTVSLSDFSTTQTHTRNGSGWVASNTAAHANGWPRPSMVPLEHLPLPNLLAVEGSVVAVASTQGPPVVSLCKISSDLALQLLQTVCIPLPPSAGPDMSKARLKGLVLLPVAGEDNSNNYSKKHLGPFNDSSTSSSTLFPSVDLAGGGVSSVLLADPVVSDNTKQQHKPMQQQQMPDVVALVTCLPAQPQSGQFISFGFGSSTAGTTAAEAYLLRCRLPAAAHQHHNTAVSCVTDKQQQQQQQMPAPVIADRPPQVPQRRWATAIVPPKLQPRQQQQQQQQQQPQQQQQQQQPLVSVLSPRLHTVASSPVTSPRHDQHTNGDLRPAAAAAAAAVMAGTARSLSTSPQQQQQQDRQSTDSLSSCRSLPQCPWVRQMQLMEEAKQQQQLEPPVQQHRSGSEAAAVGYDTAAGEVDLTLHSSTQEHLRNGEQPDLDSMASSKMQPASEGTLCLMKQQQNNNTLAPQAAATAGEEVICSEMQLTLEHVPAAMPDRQQQAGHHSIDAHPAAAAAFGTLQVALERMSDAIEQQHKQQQVLMECAQQQQAAAMTAAVANLQISLETRLDNLLQSHQKVMQDRLQRDEALVTAMTQMLGRKLDAVHDTLKELVTRLAAAQEKVEVL